ncbi:MAG TPA: tetratricopeptide repeat protein [Bryobacteraceae bacterium]|nr:tetratricopeptide repeat protein [Bryobacteraceae bacterium]
MRRLPFLCLGIVLLGAAARADTVLVLPFFNQSTAENIDWIGESIAETLRESLASQGILVLSREDRLEAYRRLSIRANAVLTHATVMKIGEALDASQVVYGYFQVSPQANASAEATAAPGAAGSAAGVSPWDSLHLSARVLDLKRSRQGPEFAEIGALEDLASLETNLAWRCLTFLAPRTAITEEDFRRDRPPLRLDAVENYIRGLMAPSPEQKHRLFTQAARLDARFSAPNFQLGKMEWEKKNYDIAAGWLEKVTRADSHYFEALFLLGLCRYYKADFAGAEKSFETVAAAVPLSEVINDLGATQSRLRNPTALDNFRRALEGDTTDPDYHFNVGYSLWKQGDFAQAAESFRALLDRNPEDAEAVVFLGRCLKKDGARAGDPRSEGRERLKLNFEETAYRQLKAELESKH